MVLHLLYIFLLSLSLFFLLAACFLLLLLRLMLLFLLWRPLRLACTRRAGIFSLEHKHVTDACAPTRAMPPARAMASRA